MYLCKILPRSIKPWHWRSHVRIPSQTLNYHQLTLCKLILGTDKYKIKILNHMFRMSRSRWSWEHSNSNEVVAKGEGSRVGPELAEANNKWIINNHGKPPTTTRGKAEVRIAIIIVTSVIIIILTIKIIKAMPVGIADKLVIRCNIALLGNLPPCSCNLWLSKMLLLYSLYWVICSCRLLIL